MKNFWRIIKKIVSNEEAQQNIIYQPAITKKKLNSENRRGRRAKGEKFFREKLKTL